MSEVGYGRVGAAIRLDLERVHCIREALFVFGQRAVWQRAVNRRTKVETSSLYSNLPQRATGLSQVRDGFGNVARERSIECFVPVRCYFRPSCTIHTVVHMYVHTVCA